MKHFLKLSLGMLRSPWRVKLWLMLLMSANMVAPWFFLATVEARVVLAATAAAMILMTVLTARSGFTRLLGLGHVVWIPLVPWLAMRLDQIAPDDAFGLWLRVLPALNSISLVLDIADVARYLRGERQELIEGLAQ